IHQMILFFKFKSSQDLFYKTKIGTLDNTQLKKFASNHNNSLINFFKKRISSEKSFQENLTVEKYDNLVFGKEKESLAYSFAGCCNSIPGDSVFGFVTVNEGIKVHQKECPNALTLQSNYAYRILPAKWIDSSSEEYSAILKLTGIDHRGLVNEVTRMISNNSNININKINFATEDQFFTGIIELSVQNKNILTKLVQKLASVNGIDKIVRK
ncbi:MAG: bifunctional (p)ppGpp synthetase/guanosine-3',5'-bis(diphosphate) 3'-pyrophosphohydrolase, partial [Flavobacteriaceae bacterium]|nr:bifunctional (p)ppGpp synthetase/guanosine-3',5'-bis(diphosphate) 3'-pyrophosphohydrolase [Flavobacteriaceae bacterium]